MVRGTNSFHEPLHSLGRNLSIEPVADHADRSSLVSAARLASRAGSIATIRGQFDRLLGAVLRAAIKGLHRATVSTDEITEGGWSCGVAATSRRAEHDVG